MRPKASSQPNLSLIDGMSVLQGLAISPEPVGSAELARKLGFEPTRTNRLLKTLASIGIARQTSSRRYAPGPGMYVLAAQSLFASGFVRSAIPALEALRELNLTVALGVLWRDTVSYLYHAPPGTSSLEAIGRLGIYPATRGGIGLSLLSLYSPAEIDTIYADAPVDGFSNLVSLKAALHRFRSAGHVFTCVNPQKGLHTIAINVGDPAHAAIGLSGAISERQVPQLVERLQFAAEQISAHPGAQEMVSNPVASDRTEI